MSESTGPELVGRRRQARERALSLLYEADSKDLTVTQLLGDLPIPPDDFVIDLVTGVESRSGEIDKLMSAHSIGWSLQRMPLIDRQVLRLATFELIGRDDIPTGVVISEAVELAKQYSTDESGRFVNGVLSAIAAEVRPQGGATTSEP